MGKVCQEVLGLSHGEYRAADMAAEAAALKQGLQTAGEVAKPEVRKQMAAIEATQVTQVAPVTATDQKVPLIAVQAILNNRCILLEQIIFIE